MPLDPKDGQSTPQQRRRTLTPEQRRFLGTPRARDDQPEHVETPVKKVFHRADPARPERTQTERERGSRQPDEQPFAHEGRSGGGLLRPDQKAARVPEMQRAILVIGAVVLLGATFFAGMKFPSWKARLMFSRNAPNLDGTVAMVDYHFYLGDTLRLNHHPRDSIPRYEHAALLARNEQQAKVCRFKIRMALLEAADASQVKEQVEAQKTAGKLSVDWLLTKAAIELREGRADEAIALILLAHDGSEPDLFTSCVTDAYFNEASRKNTRVAEARGTPSG